MKKIISIVLVGTFVCSLAMAQGGGEKKPPAHAVELCKDKAIHDPCPFKQEDGNIVEGECIPVKRDGGPLVCRPKK